MNDLFKYFENNQNRAIDKWLHYFEIYETYFSKYRGKEINILEIGLFQGGSIQLWQNYFGDKLNYYGIEIDPKCKRYEENKVKIFIGSQSDPQFLAEVISQIPKLDIIIDDGGHTMNQQIVSFKSLFNHVKDDGIYLIEDLHTSYWKVYGGGYKRQGTFINFSKNLIDKINAHHSKQKSLVVDNYTNTIKSLHYYDSVLVVLKGIISKPISKLTGNKTFENFYETPPRIPNFYQFIKYKIQKTIKRKINSFCYRLGLKDCFPN